MMVRVFDKYNMTLCEIEVSDIGAVLLIPESHYTFDADPVRVFRFDPGAPNRRWIQRSRRTDHHTA
jgi:hypothetical protein